MTLHPITVVDQVIDEYQSYLSTEFQARDDKLRQALEDALGQPRFLAQDPFFQAHRPFKSGARWDELGLDAALSKVMVTEPSSKRSTGTSKAALLIPPCSGSVRGASPMNSPSAKTSLQISSQDVDAGQSPSKSA